MSLKTNESSSLYIALTPTGTDDNTRQMTLIANSTETTFNVSMNKVDKTYFGNAGATTSQITGITNSLTVSIDFNFDNPGHLYLYKLMNNQNVSNCNDQWVKIQHPLFGNQTKPAFIEGKSCFQFKNNFPSGSPVEILKIEFDIFPQDVNWTFTEATTTFQGTKNEK